MFVLQTKQRKGRARCGDGRSPAPLHSAVGTGGRASGAHEAHNGEAPSPVLSSLDGPGLSPRDLRNDAVPMPQPWVETACTRPPREAGLQPGASETCGLGPVAALPETPWLTCRVPSVGTSIPGPCAEQGQVGVQARKVTTQVSGIEGRERRIRGEKVAGGREGREGTE